MRVQEAFDAVDQVTLQLVHVLQPFAPHPLAALRTVAPRRFSGLVATDVNVLRREQLHDLQEHVLQELERPFVARAEVAVAVRLSVASQLGIGCRHLLRMARHLDLGNHLDMPQPGVLHDLADLLLRIEAAPGARIVRLAVAAVAFPPALPVLVGPPRRELRQAGVTVNLDAPSGAVGQVHVQAVELEERHGVDLTLDELHRPEMAAHVDHEAAVGETRRILDRAAGDLLRASVVRELQQGLHGVEGARRRPRRHRDPARRDLQPVGLLRGDAARRGVDPNFEIGTPLSGLPPAQPVEAGGQFRRQNVAVRRPDRIGKRLSRTEGPLPLNVGDGNGNHAPRGGGFRRSLPDRLRPHCLRLRRSGDRRHRKQDGESPAEYPSHG